jgi:hypothetical protein
MMMFCPLATDRGRWGARRRVDDADYPRHPGEQASTNHCGSAATPCRHLQHSPAPSIIPCVSTPLAAPGTALLLGSTRRVGCWADLARAWDGGSLSASCAVTRSKCISIHYAPGEGRRAACGVSRALPGPGCHVLRHGARRARQGEEGAQTAAQEERGGTRPSNGAAAEPRRVSLERRRLHGVGHEHEHGVLWFVPPLEGAQLAQHRRGRRIGCEWARSIAY